MSCPDEITCDFDVGLGRRRFVPRFSSVVELETGMHYWENNQWKETREEIEIVNGAAVARRGPHKVIFDANLNSPGAIDLEAPDGKRFRSHILGLAYLDWATGTSVMFAEVKDCLGAVLPPNQVWYQDAFDGDCVADVRFTYTKAGFEQDIIFRVAPPSPATYGLSPESTHLAVFTEFPEAPAAEVQTIVLKQESDPARRQQLAEPDVIDQSLDFGVMKIGSGQAFSLDDPDGRDVFSGSSAPTFKSWERIEGRQFLLERVEYPAVLPQLQRLPQTAAVNRRRNVIERAPDKKLLARLFPAAPRAERTKWKDHQYAKVDSTRPGFVLDYQTINGSMTNFCFKGDTTYVIRGAVSLYQTTVIEGGTVVKFTNSVSPRIDLNGPVDCRTSMYRPAILTAKDDNTVGEVAPGSTGTPSGVYAFYPLLAKDTTTTYDFHDIRIRYATYGFPLTGKKMNLSHVQVGNVTRAVAFSNVPEINYRNFLFFDADIAFYATTSATNRVEHGTLHRVGAFISDTNNSSTTFLTNCLLISVTNSVVFAGAANVQTNASDTGVFQTVGAAGRYLATNSPYRDSGTTNINPDLARNLRKLTTYPPIVISNVIYTSDLNFQPQAQRDTDLPDLGFHYSPLDFVVGGVFVSDATITASGGVAIGTFAPSSGASYGLTPSVGSQLICEGTPTNLNRIVRYNTVQEQSNNNWTNTALASIQTSWVGGAVPATRWRFTEWSVLAQDAEHLNGHYSDFGSHSFLDCQFHGGKLSTAHPTLNLTNCLLNRVVVTLNDSLGDWNVSPVFRNTLFYGGTLDLDHQSSDAWTFKDNLFDNTWITNQAGAYTNDYNGYTTNLLRLTPNGSHDVLLASSNVNYEIGPLGSFYLPTNSVFIDRGSTNAHLLGLYHFTTHTSQVKETNSTVDIGLHYSALAVTNLALNQSASQSSTYGPAAASRAVDGNTDGNYFNNSVSSTWSDPNAWWEVNLGQVHSIDRIAVWNRTDCCPERLSNFYILVSDVAFTSTNLTTTLSQPGISAYYFAGAAGTTTFFSISRTGRFVRVQLTEPDYLSLAEVQVLGNTGPIDTDSDGIGDYLEDANGNGSLDSGETKINDAADLGLRVLITRPKSGSNIP